MEAHEPKTLERRLERLERGNHWFKRVCIALLVAMAAIALMGQARSSIPKLVEAEGFTLRDQKGNVRAKLTMGVSGPALLLFHKSDTRPDNPPHAIDVEVFDATPSVGGMPALQALTRIGLRDSAGQMLVKLDVENGLASLILRDDQFHTRAVLGHTTLEATRTGTVEQRAASSLVLFDTSGKVIWQVP